MKMNIKLKECQNLGQDEINLLETYCLGFFEHERVRVIDSLLQVFLLPKKDLISMVCPQDLIDKNYKDLYDAYEKFEIKSIEIFNFTECDNNRLKEFIDNLSRLSFEQRRMLLCLFLLFFGEKYRLQIPEIGNRMSLQCSILLKMKNMAKQSSKCSSQLLPAFEEFKTSFVGLEFFDKNRVIFLNFLTDLYFSFALEAYDNCFNFITDFISKNKDNLSENELIILCEIKIFITGYQKSKN